MPMDHAFDCFALSDTGLKRPVNEDAYVCNPDIGLFLVADGMGGANSGEVASRLTASTYENHISAYVVGEEVTIPFEHAGGGDFFLKAMQHALEMTNQTVLEAAMENSSRNGMGSTLTAALVRDNCLYIAHVGDSRLYGFQNDEFLQMTEDHTKVQEMVKRKVISAEAAKNHRERHIITKCIGRKPRIKPDIFSVDTVPGTTYLLCSDGLFESIESAEIGKIMKQQNLDAIARQLVSGANERGGRDNITVVLFRERLDTTSEG